MKEDFTKYDLLQLLQLQSEVEMRIEHVQVQLSDEYNYEGDKDDLEEELDRLGDVLFLVKAGINNRMQ